MLMLHPLILGQFTNGTTPTPTSTPPTVEGRRSTDGMEGGVARVGVIGTVDGAVIALRRSWGRRSLEREFGRTESGRDVQGALGRAQLTRLQGEGVEGVVDEEGGGVVGGRGMAVEGEMGVGGGGGGGSNSSHGLVCSCILV